MNDAFLEFGLSYRESPIMKPSARHWLSISLCAASLNASTLAGAEDKTTPRSAPAAQCADITAAFDPLQRTVESAYRKLIASAQAQLNGLIAELASASRARKQELGEEIEAVEKQMLRHRTELARTTADLDKAEARALKRCIAVVQGPTPKPSLAERCGASSRPGAGHNPATLKLSGETAEQRRRAAELIARELGAKLLTTSWSKLVRSAPLQSVAHIEGMIAESAIAAVVLLVEERIDTPPLRPPGPTLDLRDGLQGFLNERLSRFGGILLLGTDFGNTSLPAGAPKVAHSAVIHASTDGRALAAMICRSPPPKGVR